MLMFSLFKPRPAQTDVGAAIALCWALFPPLSLFLLQTFTEKNKTGFHGSAPKMLGWQSLFWHGLLQFAGPQGQSGLLTSNKFQLINGIMMIIVIVSLLQRKCFFALGVPVFLLRSGGLAPAVRDKLKSLQKTHP